MWCFHPRFGFLSLVQHRDFPDLLLVRARDREHLEELKRLHPALLRDVVIEASPAADYAYRAAISAEVMAEVLRLEVLAIDHQNVKSAVANRWGFDAPLLGAMHETWAILRRMQDRLHGIRVRKDPPGGSQ